MSIPLSYQEALIYRPPDNWPRYIVLDTAQSFRHLITAMVRLPTLVWDKDSMLAFILPFLHKEADAVEGLEYGCMELVHDAMVEAYSSFTYDYHQSLIDDTTAAAYAVVDMGKTIFNQLQWHCAYEAGILRYQPHGWCGLYDAVLVRIY